jgi:hypothetical protein
MAPISMSGGKAWDGNGWLVLSERADAPRPYPPKSTSWKNPEATIFVGISSFRDWRCPRTLFNYITKASNPARVRVGIVQQNDKDEDPDCVKGYCELMVAEGFAQDGRCPYREHIKIMRVDYRQAAGNIIVHC